MVPKRRTATSPPPKSAKRARRSVSPSETTQVTTLDASNHVPLADADVFYVPELIQEEVALAWYEELKGIDGWYRPTLKMYGKEITQSRKIAAYATDPNLVVKYSGQVVDMKYEYPPLLAEIQKHVEERLGVTFNHCMLNFYEDGNVYIGNHRDNRENRVIASLSLGAPRTFIMTHDSPPADPATSTSGLVYKKRWMLANGSLVVMQGQTQSKWKHEIPKEAKVKEGRISLTFRQLVF